MTEGLPSKRENPLVPLLPVYDREKITKGDVIPPFGKGRGEGFKKAIF